MTTSAQNVITAIPFSGFYHSLHDSELDTALERMFEVDGTGNTINQDLLAMAQDCVDWREVHKAYAAEYAECFAHEFGITGMVFESLKSPREYNFETDRIYCEIPAQTITRMLAETPPETLDAVAGEMFTSRSGFISFYTPDVGAWGELTTWDHNQRLALVTAYVLHRRDGEEFDTWAEHSLMENAFCNGAIDNMLFSGDTKRLARLEKIAAYIRERAER